MDTGRPVWRAAVLALAICLIVMAPGCRTRERGGGKPPGPVSGELLVTLPTPGDDLPSAEDMERVRGIGERIAARGAGRILRAGGGIGRLEILVRSEDLDASRRAIAEVIEAETPGVRYRIQEKPDAPP